MIEAGIRPVIAVEFDPTKPDLSRAIALNHHRNFHEYGCRIIQLTVQEVAQSGFLGFPRRPDYLHASPVCANFSQAHTAKAGKGGETHDDLTAANRQVGASLSQWLKPSDSCSHGCLP
jgi:DNA (cytosine-5)-methyltransferase 1